jgi:hypothetical protein
MISRQTKVVAVIGIVCLASAAIWQSQSHWAFEMTRSKAEVNHDAAGNSMWDPGSLYVHNPVISNVLFLVGMLGVLFTIASLIGDIKRSRHVDRRKLEHE